MTTARESLIAATINLMRRHGVAGSGLADILEESGRSRRTVYLNFPEGKSEMVAAATIVAGRVMEKTIADLAEADDPEQMITTFTDGWIAALEASDYRSGCPIVAAALSHQTAPSAAEAAGIVFLNWASVIAGNLVRAGVDEDVADALANTVVASVEGAIVMSQATSSADPIRKVAESLRRLLAEVTAAQVELKST